MWFETCWLLLSFTGVLGRTVVLPGTFYYEGVPSFERDPFNYIVAIKEEKLEESIMDEESTERVLMTSSEGVQYSCAVPFRDETENDTPKQTGEGVATKSPFDYLDALASSCLFRIENWWSFEFCYKRKIRQFHEDKEEKNKLDYTLGVSDSSAEDDDEIREDVIRGRKRKYVRQIYSDGDFCDQIDQPRTTEVRFFCDEQSQWSASAITGVVEGPTCNYIVSVSSPLLCKHPEFKTKETTRVIVCDPVAVDSEERKTEEEVELNEEVCDVAQEEQEAKDEL